MIRPYPFGAPSLSSASPWVLLSCIIPSASPPFVMPTPADYAQDGLRKAQSSDLAMDAARFSVAGRSLRYGRDDHLWGSALACEWDVRHWHADFGSLGLLGRVRNG